ncbi:MAG TPA: hypothetical protein VLH56_10580 [Dissulfurispiraceae bacterium]|nr:hypothetical protein [Dissulfurispiraceae bacterium]
MSEVSSIKFPCQLESCGFRRGTQDWGISFSSPQEVRKFTQPLDRVLNKWCVVVVFPVQNAEQAKVLLERDEDKPILIDPDDSMLIECGREQLCEDFGLEPNRVNVLAREGTVVKLKRGQYDYRASVRGYIEYLRRLAQGRGTGDYQASRAKREAQKSELAEIDLLERKGKLVLADEVVKGFEDYNAAIISALMAAPAQAEDAEAQQIMEETVERLCVELARIGGAAIVERARRRSSTPARKVKHKRMGGKGKSAKSKDKRGAGAVEK